MPNVYEMLGVQPPDQPTPPAPQMEQRQDVEEPKPRTSIGTILKEEALATPGRMLSGITSPLASAYETAKREAGKFVSGEPLSQPPMRVVLPLVAGGPGSTVLTRLGAQAAGAVLDDPKATPSENLQTAMTAVIGDPKNPASMLTSPAAIETAAGVGGLLTRSILPGAAQQRYARRIGENLSEATGGVLPAPRNAAELDALVRGAQDPATGRLISGRQTLGNFYAARVRDADTAIGGLPVHVPSLDDTPMPLGQAIHDVQNIAAGQVANRPLTRSAVGRTPRELRQQVWNEIQGEVMRHDPSGAAWAQLQDARNTFAVGKTYLDAVEKSGAITRGPNNVGFDSSKLQQYVSNNRDKFIRVFENAGDPEGFRQLVTVVFRGGPIGSRDVLAGTTTPAQAIQQLLRSGGGAGTAAVLPIRTALPGLGSTYTGQAPYSLPGPALTLSEILAQPPREGAR